MEGGWARLLLLLALAALVRAGVHFIRIALLAAMGLAGMYMLHMLAQDYNKISNRPARPAVAAGKALLRAITKRDVHDVHDDNQVSPTNAVSTSPDLQPAAAAWAPACVGRQPSCSDARQWSGLPTLSLPPDPCVRVPGTRPSAFFSAHIGETCRLRSFTSYLILM